MFFWKIFLFRTAVNLIFSTVPYELEQLYLNFSNVTTKDKYFPYFFLQSCKYCNFNTKKDSSTLPTLMYKQHQGTCQLHVPLSTGRRSNYVRLVRPVFALPWQANLQYLFAVPEEKGEKVPLFLKRVFFCGIVCAVHFPNL